jgi:hypothetical protein
VRPERRVVIIDEDSTFTETLSTIFGVQSGEEVAEKPEARDFVADAFALQIHRFLAPNPCHFWKKPASPKQLTGNNPALQLWERLGICVALGRLWEREAKFSA